MVQRGMRRRWLACAVMAGVAAVSLGASAGYANGTFDAPYLGGISGPRPARSVDLAGTWAFQTCRPRRAPAALRSARSRA